MKAIAEKSNKQNKSKAVANNVSQQKGNGQGTLEFVDQRADMVTQQKIRQRINKEYARNQSVQSLNVIQGYFAAYSNDWQSYVVKVPTGSNISSERKAYLKQKVNDNGVYGSIVFEEVSDSNARITDKDYLYITTDQSFADIDLDTAEVTKIELSDVLPTYNAKYACVLQALIKLKGTVLGKSTPEALHDHIYATENLAAYKEYDLDSVYPGLYGHVGLTSTSADNGKLKDVAQGLTPGKYIFEAASITSGSSGHNFVVQVIKQSKNKKTWNIIQDSENTVDIADGDKIKMYWS